MKRILILLVMGFQPVLAQITSVVQLVDVKPADEFHSDLQSLVERWGVVGAAELKVAANEAGPAGAGANQYFPRSFLTRRQLVIALDAALGTLGAMAMATEDSQRGLLEEAKIPKAKAEAIFSRSTEFSSGLLRRKSVGIKVDLNAIGGLSRESEEFAAMRNLLERYQIGNILLESDGSFTAGRRIGELHLISIFGLAFGIQPEKRGLEWEIGGLPLNLPAHEMTRGRFAMILNHYLDVAMEKLSLQPEATRKAITELKIPAVVPILNLQTIINGANARQIRYQPSSAELAAVSEPFVDEIAKLFKHLPAGVGIEIAVHTDSGGIESNNLKLTQARADAVKAALVRRGIPRERLIAIGFGSGRTIADNRTEAGRLRNRRTEFNAWGF